MFAPFCCWVKYTLALFMYVLRITAKVSQEFLTGVGNQLNQELITQDRKNKHTSYISGKMGFCSLVPASGSLGGAAKTAAPGGAAEAVLTATDIMAERTTCCIYAGSFAH